jgi:hypothetical protein
LNSLAPGPGFICFITIYVCRRPAHGRFNRILTGKTVDQLNHTVNVAYRFAGFAPVQDKLRRDDRQGVKRDFMQSVETLTDVKQQGLLSRKISELPLKMEGTHLEGLIMRLYKELEAAGIAFKPNIYLSDSWGCPNEVPVIGVPFHLADPALCNLLGQTSGIEVENDMTMMRILRHEAGHAFNYAYRLYDKPEWKALFGSFSQPYQEDYQVDPSSTRFVHHLAGCYAQKHPDDDFAETFAVWLTPCSHWQTAYIGTPALEKLQYVESVTVEYGEKPPIVTGGRVDMPVEEIKMTLSEWYETVYKNRINQDQLTQVVHPGISECPQVITREAVVISCPNYSPA